MKTLGMVFGLAALGGIVPAASAATITGTVKTSMGNNPSGAVTIRASNGTFTTTTSPSYSTYTLGVPDGWTGEWIAAFAPPPGGNYLVNVPAYHAVTNASGSYVRDFTLQVGTVENLSGKVTASAGGNLSNTLVYASAGVGGGAITDALGNYVFGVVAVGPPPNKWTGTVKPLKGGYVFLPPQTNYTARTTPITGCNFVGTQSGGGDTQAPTWPQGSLLVASETGPTSTRLDWTTAQDNVGVVGYKIFRDSEPTPCATVAGATNTTVSGLSAETTYTFKAEAYDAAGNTSNTGPSRQVTTAATAPPLPPVATNRLVVSRHTAAPSGPGTLGKAKLVLMDLDGGNEADLTDGTTFDTLPYCSPLGTQIVFARVSMSGLTRQSEVMRINVDGTGLTNLTSDVDDPCNCPHWSWDGTKIAYDRATQKTGGGIDGDLYVMDPDGGNKTLVLGGTMEDAGDDSSAFFSPDGRWLLCQRMISLEPDPRSEIWKVQIATGAATQLSQLDPEGDDEIDETPSWSPDGKTVVFKRGKELACDVWAVDAAGGNERNVTGQTDQPIGEAHYTFDGGFIFYQTNTGGVDPDTAEVFRMDPDGGNQVQITTNSLPDWDPAPSPRYGGDLPTQPTIATSITNLTIQCVTGQTATATEFLIRNSGGGTLAYTVGDGAAWLTPAPESGSCVYEQDVVALTFGTDSLAPGDYTATLTVAAPGAANTPFAIPVALHVKELWEDDYVAWKADKDLPPGEDDPYDDPDEDCQCNLHEMVCRTDPMDEASCLRVATVAFGADDFTLTFPTETGVCYQPQASSNLVDWANAGDVIVGNGTDREASAVLAESGYVRVRVVED